MKIYIRGFAEAQKEIERDLTSHTIVVIEHLMKIYLMPDHESAYHWKKEIASQIYIVDKLKNNKKFPTAKQIYSWTYGKKQDLITDRKWFQIFVEDICEEYNRDLIESPMNFMNEFDDICVSYFQWLSNELSQTGRVSKSAIISKIDQLI